MRISKNYRPISYLKANADQLAEELAAGAEAIVITRYGVPTFVCVRLDDYCQLQDTASALLGLVTLGEREILNGNYMELSESRSTLDKRIRRTGSKAKPKY